MVYYRFKGKDDLWLGKYGKSQKTLIPNELLTQKQIDSIKKSCPRLSIEKAFEQVNLKPSDTYSAFGVRFQDGWDHNGMKESAKKGSKYNMKLRISEARSSNGEANAYVVFRQYYNDYTGTWEPIAFWWGDGQPMTYGRVNIIEQDGNVPHMRTPRYVNDEADINYFSETKAFGSGDDGFDEFSDYVRNWLLKDERGDGFDNVIYRTRLDRYGIRDAWMSRYK